MKCFAPECEPPGLIDDSTAGSAAASGSAAVVDDATCTVPESHLQTLLMWDCTGKVRLMPDNPLFNVNADIPMLPRLLESLYKGLQQYIRGQCTVTPLTNTQFSDRYHPLSGMLYGNRLYSAADMPRIGCLDDDDAFTRDWPKLFRALAGYSSFEMPASCKYDFWEKAGQQTARTPGESTCSFTHELMEIGAQLQIIMKRCDAQKDFFQLSVGCAGSGCNIFMPCTTDDQCAAKDHLICADPFNWRDIKIQGSEPKFTEKEVYVLFTEWFKLYTADYEANQAVEHYPKEIFKQFLAKFAQFFQGSPETRSINKQKGQTCDPNNPDSVCKICLPAHTTAFETILSDFPGRWREVSEEYPKDRNKMDNDGCALSPSSLTANTSTLIGDADNGIHIPTILAPVQPVDTSVPATDPPTLKYQANPNLFVTESPLVQGSSVFFKGSESKIGGARCDPTKNECGSGLCITDDTDYCELSQDECDRHTLCELINKKCVPIHLRTPSVYRCACFSLDRFTDTDSVSFVFGEQCEKAEFISNIESSDILDSFFTTGVHKWRSRYDPFIYWDGLKSADGLDPFAVRSHWVPWPEIKAPEGETHLLSMQCDGVIHMFMNTPSHIRIFAPKANDLAQFWSEQVLATWKARDNRHQLGDDEKIFLVNQALFRPEPWLFAKVWDQAHNDDAREPEEKDYDTLLRAVFTGMDRNMTEVFDIWNFNHLAKVTEKFTLTEWFKSGYIGATYYGMQGQREYEVNGVAQQKKSALVFERDTKFHVRVQNCPNYKMGLVGVDLTCEGKACLELLLRTPCSSAGDCSTLSKCLPAMQSVYDEDLLSQVLWGVARIPQQTPAGDDLYTKDSLCPALETIGKRGYVACLRKSAKSTKTTKTTTTERPVKATPMLSNTPAPICGIPTATHNARRAVPPTAGGTADTSSFRGQSLSVSTSVGLTSRI